MWNDNWATGPLRVTMCSDEVTFSGPTCTTPWSGGYVSLDLDGNHLSFPRERTRFKSWSTHHIFSCWAAIFGADHKLGSIWTVARDRQTDFIKTKHRTGIWRKSSVESLWLWLWWPRLACRPTGQQTKFTTRLHSDWASLSRLLMYAYASDRSVGRVVKRCSVRRPIGRSRLRCPAALNQRR